MTVNGTANGPFDLNRDADGYRREPAGGPHLRTDIVDVYIFRTVPSAAGSTGESLEFLQVFRAKEPLKGTWHPVMGHVELGETAAACAAREMEEEAGLAWGSPEMLGMWALEQVHPYFVAAIDAVVMGPRFAVQAAPAWAPALDGDNASHRWVPASESWRRFMWPGQVAAVREVLEHLMRPGSLCREALRIRERDLGPVERCAGEAAVKGAANTSVSR